MVQTMKQTPLVKHNNMAVGLKLGNITDEVGGQDFFHAFFSTISYRLEVSGWGSRFPYLLKHLYQGKLIQEYAKQALDELDIIAAELKRLPPEKVVWDIENLDAAAPWGNKISSDITDLSNYFVTSAGRDLISVMRECIEELRDTGGMLEVVVL